MCNKNLTRRKILSIILASRFKKMTSIIRPSTNLCQQCRWHSYSAISSLQHAAVQAIISASQRAISERGAFHIVLAGGKTPRNVYGLLTTIVTDWRKWHIYFGDERCLPKVHTDRNSKMAAEAWLDNVNIPAGQIHIIPAEQDAEAAASAYEQTLINVDLFDLVILGLGEDGHTASLFPQHDWGIYPAAPAALAIHHAPKPPPERVSLSAHRLSKTRQLIFLVTGATKQQAVRDWRDGKKIPASAITPDCGVDIFIEESLIL